MMERRYQWVMVYFSGRNEAVDVLSILAISPISIYVTHVEVNRPIKSDIDV